MPSFVRISHRVRVTPCDLLPGKINPWINIFRIIYHGRVFNSDNNKKYYDTVTLLIADKSIECSSPGHKRRAIEVTEIFLWNNLEIGFARDNQVDTLTSSTSLHSRRTSLRWLSRCSWYFSFFIFFFFYVIKLLRRKSSWESVFRFDAGTIRRTALFEEVSTSMEKFREKCRVRDAQFFARRWSTELQTCCCSL